MFDPDLVKQVFQGPGEQLRAGEANALLGPILGERSVLLLDGSEHLRHRRLMLPAFHGQLMLAHTQTMRACTDVEIDSWPIDEPFALLPSMQSLTLRVILRVVFGYEPGAAEAELRRRLRAMVEPLARPAGSRSQRPCCAARPGGPPLRGSSSDAGEQWTRFSTRRSRAGGRIQSSRAAATCSPRSCSRVTNWVSS